MKYDPLKHLKIKSCDEWHRIFAENFDPIAYEEAVAPIKAALAESKAPDELYFRFRELENMGKYDGLDIEYADDFTMLWIDVELDRNRMETEADYVGVSFYIEWYDNKKCGAIKMASLYSNVFSKQYIADELCLFDPETYMIMDWLY